MRFHKLLCLGVVAAALPISAQAEILTGLLRGNRLASISSNTGLQLGSIVDVTGLAGGETLVGIDYRPATGTLYGVGSTSVIYAINAQTGVATATGPAGGYALSGNRFGVDFNPVPDRLRVVSDADQNLRLNPNNNGLGANDGTLAYDSSDPRRRSGRRECRREPDRHRRRLHEQCVQPGSAGRHDALRHRQRARHPRDPGAAERRYPQYGRCTWHRRVGRGRLRHFGADRHRLSLNGRRALHGVARHRRGDAARRLLASTACSTSPRRRYQRRPGSRCSALAAGALLGARRRRA